jgi:hypothetical protein
MRSSPSRTSGSRGDWRLAAVLAVIMAVGGLVAFTQFSGGGEPESSDDVALAGARRCVVPREAQANGARSRAGWYVDRQGATQHIGDGQVQVSSELRRRCAGNWARPSVNPSATTDPVATTDPNNGGGNNGGGQNGGGNDGGGNDGGGQNGGGNGGQEPTPSASTSTSAPPAPLEILGNNCDNSQLAPHDGFQNGDRCVSTAFGEVANADSNPSLLIVDAPEQIAANTAFDIQVSTRNLVRDRFLAAGQGGYYVESSFLNEDGIVRGHFHTACRILASTDEAPDPAPAPAFFVATEDSQGSRTPDTVTVRVPGLPAGLAQCAVWAGDGSHRIPMMQRANQTPAFDVVRIAVG